jgi:hypothetical protein
MPHDIAPSLRLQALQRRIETARSAIRRLSPNESLPAFDAAELGDLQQIEARGIRLAQWFEGRAAELAEAAAACNPTSVADLDKRNSHCELQGRLSAARGSPPPT